ncbi:SDR family oxidoreductase, partial [Variovorax sp. CT11-76]
AVRLLGEAALALECDVSDAPAVRTAVDRAAQWLGGVDALVNSAGIDALKSLEATSDEEWARVLAVNLTGPMLVCRAARPPQRPA